MDYSQILSRAWQIIWKHKVLWIFGILAGCAGGRGGGNINYSEHNSYPVSFQQILDNIPQSILILIISAVVVLILILVLVSIFLSTIGKIGVVKGTLQADQNMDVQLTSEPPNTRSDQRGIERRW